MKNKTVTLETLGTNFETLSSTVEKINSGIEKLNRRFDNVDEEIGGLGVQMEAMDDKFTLMSEAQDVIREVLETKVAHIEEVLEIKSAI
jgi:predicted  nucleic acid-binding Zn-ribbon protein